MKKLSAKVHLFFNINKFKHKINHVFESKIQIKPKCNKAHVYLTFINEFLLNMILHNTQQYIEKDKDGLYTITKQSIKYAIVLDNELNSIFSQYFSKYDEKLGYEYIIPKKLVMTFIESKFGKTINITLQGYDFLIYLLNVITNNIITSCMILLEYSDKKTIGYKTFVTAIKFVFYNSDVIKDTYLRSLEQLYILIDNINDPDDEEDNKDTNNKEDDNKEDDNKEDDNKEDDNKEDDNKEDDE